MGMCVWTAPHAYAIISVDVNRKEQYLGPGHRQARSAAAEEARDVAARGRPDVRIRPGASMALQRNKKKMINNDSKNN
jgi:hypothetical protein